MLSATLILSPERPTSRISGSTSGVAVLLVQMKSAHRRVWGPYQPLYVRATSLYVVGGHVQRLPGEFDNGGHPPLVWWVGIAGVRGPLSEETLLKNLVTNTDHPPVCPRTLRLTS